MSKIHLIRQVQKLPVTVEEAWNFFSNPKNLLIITPASLNLKITSEANDGEIYKGQIITYKIKPLFGVPLFWKTEISHVERHKLFVDEQRKGPYALWHHQHHFKPIDGGTEMTDIVQYKLPFGVLGILGTPVVKTQLNAIFQYRKKMIEKKFEGLS
jgi:ligand-binding SRPBCC domain-containing protein